MTMPKLIGITFLMTGLFAFGALTKPALANISEDEVGSNTGSSGYWNCHMQTSCYTEWPDGGCMADVPNCGTHNVCNDEWVCE